jgi:hypothetical protein
MKYFEYLCDYFDVDEDYGGYSGVQNLFMEALENFFEPKVSESQAVAEPSQDQIIDIPS